MNLRFEQIEKRTYQQEKQMWQASTINIGTLFLGIYVAAAKLLVWMGAANKTVNPGKNQENK